jgi:hypothetical protein
MLKEAKQVPREPEVDTFQIYPVLCYGPRISIPYLLVEKPRHDFFFYKNRYRKIQINTWKKKRKIVGFH